MTGWIVAALLAGVLVLCVAWGGAEYARLDETATRYATTIAACANGGTFYIGETRRVRCVAREVPAVY